MQRARQEVDGAQLGDRRLNARLIELAGALAVDPDASLPRSLDEAGLEAAYRFLANERVTPERVLAPHVAETAKRIGEWRTCVVAHDTTEFKFSGEREGLGRLHQDTRGFFGHFALAITLDDHREPLGVLGLETWTRADGRRPREHPRQRRLDPTRESQRWWRLVERVQQHAPDGTHLIHVMDREADAYDLLDQLTATRTGFVVRFCHDRRVLDEEADTLLVADKGRYVATRSVVLSRRSSKGRKPKDIAAHPARESRQARLAIHARAIALRCPKEMYGVSSQISLNLVTVEEQDAPAGEEPISWRLYTTEPIDSVDGVLRIVDAYRCRWRIEEYFKALKTGCKIEKRQLEHIDGLLNLLAIYIPIAWQLLALRAIAARAPHEPATIALDRIQLTVLRRAARRPLPDEPSVEDAVLAIAGMGGHLKRNGAPGWQTLGAGLERLLTLVEGYRLAKQM